jgi:hypothetical protein
MDIEKIVAGTAAALIILAALAWGLSSALKPEITKRSNAQKCLNNLGLLKKSETFRALGDKPKTCSALRGAVNTMDGSFPAFPKLSRALNPAWEYRPLQGSPAASLENLGEGHRRNRSISLLFKALDSFSVGPR